METFINFILDNRSELLEQVAEHLWLTLVSVTLATVTGIALGILITRKKQFTRPVLWFANGVQTIPSIALLGVLLPLVGIGPVPAIIALFLYGLLPVIRNTYAGIAGVDPAVKEAAIGMGLSGRQQLLDVELPLATPVIFAGIRTAFVINVGVATLCALIAAGGLGEFIFRGLSTNNPHMILAGALPAAAIALLFDALLGYFEKHIRRLRWPVMITFIVLALAVILFRTGVFSASKPHVTAGFPSEFIEREDGLPGLESIYELRLDVREMEIGLMYEAVRTGAVDVISGFSTDGRIAAFDLEILEDDRHYFPPYHAAPLIRKEALEKYPRLKPVLQRLAGKLTDPEMARLNYQVDEQRENIRDVAAGFLESIGVTAGPDLTGTPDIRIGSKNFTESYILAEIFSILIESETGLIVETRMGFGGTSLLFDALRTGEVDLYPEYTGTGLLVILQPDPEALESLAYEKDEIYTYVKEAFRSRYELEWLDPLGFNNTFALMVRRPYAQRHGLETISDLSEFSQSD